ncbi:IS66-like element accessory protein TnpA [Cupriavidus necator]|uniref:Transposase IS3/IS911 n=1 Tax=Cupriavidus pinatubonensis (strain JMP 134 / LMG 1197) TaxID=264198 RepID=Q46MX9_CUPPJ|nr:transposase [Cupriavidus necator]
MITDDIDVNCFPLRVVRVRRNGKRDCDPVAKRRLIELCLRPGASVAGMALKAQVNANQLRKWIRLDRESKAVEHGSLAAFVPVVQGVRSPEVEAVVTAPRRTTAVAVEPQPQPSRPVALLSAKLPNGVAIELACGERDGELVKAMIEALGAS